MDVGCLVKDWQDSEQRGREVEPTAVQMGFLTLQLATVVICGSGPLLIESAMGGIWPPVVVRGSGSLLIKVVMSIFQKRSI